MHHGLLGGPAPPLELVDAVYRDTQGNPFFVEEVFQHLTEEQRLFDDEGRWRKDLDVDELEVPEGVRLVIARRLKRVSGEAQRVLTAAAIVGRSFGLEVLEAIGDVTGDRLLDAVEEAERAHLIVPVSSREARWEFSHALIRQTLTERLSVPRRQRLHLRVADAITQAAASPETVAADVAHHLWQAGDASDGPRTVRYLTLAGERALDAGGFDEALRNFDRGLSLEPAQDDVRSALLFRRGLARRGLDQWDAAIENWNDTLALYEVLSDHPAVVTTCRVLADAYLWTMRGSEALPIARRGLAVIGGEPSADRSRLLAYSGWALSMLAEFDAATDALAEAFETVETLDSERVEGEVRLTGHYVHHHNLRSAEGYQSARRAVECLRSAQEPGRLVEALVYLHFMCVRTGRVNDLIPLEHEIEALFKRQGRLDLQIMAALTLHHRDWLLSGSPDHYETFTREFSELSAKMGAWVFMGKSWAAQTEVWKGRWADARRHAQAAAEVEPVGNAETGHGWSALFLCDALLGHRSQALDLLAEKHDQLPRVGRLNGIGAWSALLRVVEGLAVLGEAERAAELYPRTVDAVATGTLVPRDATHLMETIAGIAAASGRRWTNAQAHYERALRQAHEIPFRSEQPEVRRWYAQMLLNRNSPGDRDKARTLLGEATDMYRTIGMPKHLEMVEKMSAAL